jgi:hypothetical protein
MMEDQPDHCISSIEKWFESDIWESITTYADQDCEDSIQVLNHVNDLLYNLIWHISCNSSYERIVYEIKQFNKYIKQYSE